MQRFGADNDAVVRFQTPPGADAGAVATRVKAAVSGALGQVSFLRTDVVGPEVSSELEIHGIEALLTAVGLMLIYIWFRFELQFGLGAVVALFHDLLLSFGLILLLRLEFSLNLIAALLTIIGYSMNDTVVVFDRLRENRRKYKRMPLRQLIDLSVNETLSRTVITGLTALLALSGLAVFGGQIPAPAVPSCCCSASSSAPIRRSTSPRRSSCCAGRAPGATNSAKPIALRPAWTLKLGVLAAVHRAHQGGRVSGFRSLAARFAAHPR